MPPQIKGLAGRYTRASAVPKPRIIARLTGEIGSGKTDFALGAPGPVVVHTFDQGTEGVIENHVAEGKEIYTQSYDLGIGSGGEVSHADVVALRDRFVTNFEQDITEKLAKSMIVDRESDFWNWHVFAETGTDDRFGAAPAKDWPKIKAKERRLIAMAKAANVNLLIIQGMRNEWSKSVNPKTGNMTSTPNGNRIPDGMDEVGADVHIDIHFTREDFQDEASKFWMRVGKSRGPGSRLVQGQTFQLVKDGPEKFGFAEFAQLVFPNTTEADWV
jgi:hypothetical protein